MIRFLKKLPLFELAALIITITTLVDWLPVKQGLSMSTVTSIAFIFCIASKFLFEYGWANERLLLGARVLAICTIMLGAASIIILIFNLIPIDNIFERTHENITERSGDDIVIVTASCFILIGIALYRITFNNAKKIFLPHFISIVILFISMLSMIAYLFNENAITGIEFYKPMKMMAAVCFFLLAISILLVNKREGFIGDFTGEYQGSKIARNLLPILILIPVITGFFQIGTEKVSTYSRPYEVALLTIGRIIVLILFVWRCAVIINRSNKKLVEEIEERKKIQNSLQYRTALLEAQYEAIPDAILVVNQKGKILSYNHQFAEMWHMPQEIINAKDDTAALNFAMTGLVDPNGFIERVNYIYEHPEKAFYDEILFKDGRIIERHGNVVTGEDGTKYGWAWYFRDITLTKNYEKEINAFNKRLETKVKERTEELHKSEMRFRLLVENSHDIISLIDFEGRIIYMSPSIKRLTGFTEREMIGRSGFDTIHPDDVEGGKKFRLSLIEKPAAPEKSTFRLKQKNGGYIWVEGTVTNMLNDENVKAFVLNYHDITGRIKAEENIRNSEKRFRSLLENAHDLISLSDGKGNLFYVSPSVERITGHAIAETINHTVYDFVHPDDLDYAESIRQEFFKRPGESIYILFRYRHKSGEYIWMEGTVINLLQDENINAIVGNFHDVTERKASEEKVRISNERYEIVSRATNDAVWDWNLETDRIYWNDEIRSMFDFCADDIASGTEWKIHIHKDDFKRVTKKLLHHIKNKIQNWQDEYRFMCADGTFKFVFSRGFILYNNNDKPYRIIGAMQDVTQINKLEQSLNEERIKKQKELTNATIQGQEKERTEIGRELHDNINQLLTATKLYLDVAINQPAMKDEMISRSIDNVRLCMEEIRKLSSALVAPSIGINSFNDIIKDVVEPVSLAAGISIKYDVDDISKNALSGEQQLNVYRIVQEHLNNILKHSRAKNVFISIKKVNGMVEINMKDDGQGFNVSARRTGIGFKNIQSRAELLNGKMKVTSKPGQGCQLTVNFPLIEENVLA